MPPPDKSDENGGRLSGLDMCNYMEKFAATFLTGKAKFQMETEVDNITRTQSGEWEVTVTSVDSGAPTKLTFSRIVLATGGCSSPKIPDNLSHRAADKAGFRGIVIHSSQFGPRLQDILAAVQPALGKPEDDTVLVVGGGKSGQDICVKLALEGRKVAIVFETTDVFLASRTPIPAFVRKSRFLPVLSPHSKLNTRLERFLHTTYIGSWITHFIWNILEAKSFDSFDIPKDSPLRKTPHSLFWGVRLSDEGSVRPTSFYSLVMSGEIEVIAPARVSGYVEDGLSMMLNDGRTLSPKAVILATGYQSSWSKIFTPAMAEELGITRHAPQTVTKAKWDYVSLTQHRPTASRENDKWVTSIYRGLVPAKNIEKRDFAIAGALFTTNPGYTNEVVAHWVSSYFQGDTMRLPLSPEAATAEAEEQSAWMKARYPNIVPWVNESYSGSLDFLTWPQAADELLEDMYLPSMRSGGNWLNWVFQVIDSKEIKNLGDERRDRRALPE
ncbi:hypothetical protein B0H34DRAFT_737616 [Crassisporium funariophilum]|nr:hypothetical protein B0H34DRAFT_737616 [Crassisporium funariophilum]